MQWWSAIQPHWRDTGEWPWVKEDAAGRDWGHLVDGGKDGLFLVVVSLGWWIHARDLSEESKVDDAVMDVVWVLDNIISLLAADAATSDSVSDSSVSSRPRQKRTKSVKIGPPSKRRRSKR